VLKSRGTGGCSLTVTDIEQCDNCKSRKVFTKLRSDNDVSCSSCLCYLQTKCDRRSPCASCVTLKVACRITHAASEKRQRVLLSSKYEEAVQDVNRQLAEVKDMLQALMLENSRPAPSPASPGKSSGHAQQTPRSMIDEKVPTLSTVSEGFVGDSSFQSQAHGVKDALEQALSASHLSSVEAPAVLPPKRVNDLLPASGKGTSSARCPGSEASAATPVIQPLDTDFESKPMPPIDVVLKLLRLAKSEKQRLFVDMPIFYEDEFTDMCRDLYFAIEPISIWLWISTNVGLYFLLLGVTEANCRHMGMTQDELGSYCVLLRANLEAAMQSLRLCAEPSIESARALVVLVRVQNHTPLKTFC
jgi:hypothetical protein